MDNMRLIHDDVAYVMAHAILETVGPCLRDEEKLAALEEFFNIAKAGLESFVIQRNRELARLKPCRN